MRGGYSVYETFALWGLKGLYTKLHRGMISFDVDSDKFGDEAARTNRWLD